MWFYIENRQKKGPVSEQEISRLIGTGAVNPTTLVWQAGMTQWTKIPQTPLAKYLKTPAANPGAAQPANPARYFVGRGGTRSGPFSSEQVLAMLASGAVAPTDPGWKEGMANWQPLSVLFNLPVAMAPGVALSANGPSAAVQPVTGTGHLLTRFPTAVVIILHFVTFGHFSLFWLAAKHGRLPKVRPDDPSGARAVGFLFIPLFNIYWIYVMLRRLGLRVDEQKELYGLPRSNLQGLAKVTAVCWIVPVANLIALFVLIPIFLGRLQSDINKLADSTASGRPQRTLQVLAPAAPVRAWAIALIVALYVFGMIGVVGLMASALEPALAQAKAKAERISCQNQMKQVGIGFQLWANDHDDAFPFNLSTNKGGTLELCALGGDGFDTGAFAHFQALSNELSSPALLVCPSATGKEKAGNWGALQPVNVSYLLHTGTNVSAANSQVILAICPVHHLVLLADGSVQTVSETELTKIQQTFTWP